MKKLLKQALDALIDSVDDSRDVLTAHLADWGESWRPERIAAMRKTVADTEAAIAALRAELAKPDTSTEQVINELERLYKNALKREFDLSQALEAAVSNNLDKLMGMSDEQIRALAGFDGHHHDDLAALARQTFEIALLKAELAKHSEPHIPAPRGFIAQPSIDGVVRTNTINCNRHPYAPHGPDGDGCKCHSWSPGDAS